MTFKEKLSIEHPEWVDDWYVGGCKCCPKDYGYETLSLFCCQISCQECWNREIETAS